MKPNDNNIMNQILNEEAFFVKQKQGNMHTFIMDDDKTILLEKLLSLQRLQPADRENYIKHLSYCLKYLGDDGLEHMPTILEKFKAEQEKFQLMLIEQLYLIYENIPKLSIPAQQSVISILSYFLLNSPLSVKEEAGVQLAKIGTFLKGDDRGNQILPIIIKMAHDDNNEENRTVALQLMGKMSKLLERQLCESFISVEILSLGEDTKQMVRKEAVSQLPQIMKIVSPECFSKKLLPFYLKKCKESTKIKQACVDIFLSLSELVPLPMKSGELTNQFLTFQQDTNKVIKGVAFRQLARFIAQFEGVPFDPRLFDNYLKMADNDIKDLLPEFQVMFACAYSFPAVLTTVGINKWPQMLKLFNNLWKTKDLRVRKTLAASLHEVAKLIGPQQSERDLFPILENIFVKEPNDSVLMGCVKKLSHFLKIFSDEKKETLLEIFFFIQKNQKKWRIRESIALQLDEMTQAFPQEVVFKMIVPIAFKLCSDSVSQVRRVAASKIHTLFASISDDFKICLIENIIGFQKSQLYSQRQTFVHICDPIMNTQGNIFETYFLPGFLELQEDPVAGVRYTLAQTIQSHILRNGPFSQNNKLLNVLATLQNDKMVKKLLKTQLDANPEIGQFEQAQQPANIEEEVGEICMEEVDEESLPERPQQEVPIQSESTDEITQQIQDPEPIKQQEDDDVSENLQAE